MSRIVIILFALVSCTRSDPNEAATEFMRQVPGATEFRCSTDDSDGDGLCACAVLVPGRKTEYVRQFGGWRELLCECGRHLFHERTWRGCQYRYEH